MVSGNISPDTCSKRLLFVKFFRFGRIAEISIKSQFGFVQYLDPHDARAAVAGAREFEIAGRRIKCQMATDGKLSGRSDRAHSPDRRSRGGNRRASDWNHYRDRDGRKSYRSASPYYYDHRGEHPSNSRDRGFRARHPRSRSRSPQRRWQNSTRRDRRDEARPVERRDEPRIIRERCDVQILLLKPVSDATIQRVEDCLTEQQLSYIVKNMFSREPFSDAAQTEMIRNRVRAVILVDRSSEVSGEVRFRIFKYNSEETLYDDYPSIPPNAVARKIRDEISPPVGLSYGGTYRPSLAGPGPAQGYPYNPSPYSAPHVYHPFPAPPGLVAEQIGANVGLNALGSSVNSRLPPQPPAYPVPGSVPYQQQLHLAGSAMSQGPVPGYR